MIFSVPCFSLVYCPFRRFYLPYDTTLCTKCKRKIAPTVRRRPRVRVFSRCGRARVVVSSRGGDFVELRVLRYFLAVAREENITRAAARLHPQVQFHIYSANADDVKERIEKGLLDMGLLAEPVDIGRYDFLRMPQKGRWGVLVPNGHPLARRPKGSAGRAAVLRFGASVRRADLCSVCARAGDGCGAGLEERSDGFSRHGGVSSIFQKCRKSIAHSTK